MEDPAVILINADLASETFQAGCEQGRWRVVDFSYPCLDFKVSAIEPNGAPSEYGFRADLTNYPGVAPEVRLWILEENRKPRPEERPKGGTRVTETFKDWGSGTIYRPWDRQTGPHNNNATAKPHLAWTKDRDLAFIFEDLHGILVSNGRKVTARAAA